MAFTSREGVTDSKNSSGKVGCQVGEAAKVAARQGPVQEHAQAQQADGVVRVATKAVGRKSQHLKTTALTTTLTKAWTTTLLYLFTVVVVMFGNLVQNL